MSSRACRGEERTSRGREKFLKGFTLRHASLFGMWFFVSCHASLRKAFTIERTRLAESLERLTTSAWSDDFVSEACELPISVCVRSMTRYDSNLGKKSF